MDFLDFSAYDFETWQTFLKDKWLIIAIALLVLIFIIRLVKTVVKWLLVAVIVIGLILYSGYSLDDVKQLGTNVTTTLKQEAVELMVAGAKDAVYEVNKDGSFIVKTKLLELKGKAGEKQVTVSLRGIEIGKLDIDDTIKKFIEQAKNSS
ncbi:hypothetical protein ACFSTH_16490 [Paenibacillus yanchengensis]|uniref:ATPase n=1 Tax=Paenibacillus yanchengensis TaxID=2035833 RepID=A0ABW4YQ75_9BACL